MSKHTPTPWAHNGYTARGEYHKACAVWTADDETFICSTTRGKMRMYDADSSETKDANAKFIVRACNAHDELLALVRDALERFTDNDMQPPNAKLEEWIGRAVAAIAKAEGIDR